MSDIFVFHCYFFFHSIRGLASEFVVFFHFLRYRVYASQKLRPSNITQRERAKN